MGEIFLGTEALASGQVTRHGLQTRYRKVHQNVYATKGFEFTPRDQAVAAWLWSDRRASLAGHSAAAIFGSRWLPADAPAELSRFYRSSARGIVIHTGQIAGDELMTVGGMSCTTVARTGYDLGRRLPFQSAVIRIDALLNATGGRVADIAAIAERYPGARGIRRLRRALEFVDGGSESPQETRLRLLLVQAGLPRPETQIPEGRRRIDMGYRQWKVAIEYDGEQHWTDPRQHAEDIERLEFLASRRWVVIRVSAEQLRRRPHEVVERVRRALRAAGCPI